MNPPLDPNRSTLERLSTAIRQPSRGRRIAIGLAIALVALVAIAWIAVPIGARWGLETVATRELGRTVHLGSASFNPLTLKLALRDIVIDGAAGEPKPLASIRRTDINLSSTSLLRFAPIVDALAINGLELNIIRFEPQRFNFSDIIERIQAKPKTKPAEFSVGNIEVNASRIDLDDRVTASRHELTDIAIGIPFISSLETDIEVKVQPAFAARLDGTPINLKGETTPFADTLESSINLKLDGLDLVRYLSYSPVRLNFVLGSGSLDTDLRLAFRRAAAATKERPAIPPQTLLTGRFAVNGLQLAAPAGGGAQPLMAWKSLRVDIGEFEPIARRLTVTDVALDAPAARVVRGEDGSLNWQTFAQRPLVPDSAPPAPAAPAAPSPFALTLKHASVTGGQVDFIDMTFANMTAGRFEESLLNVAIEASNLTNTSEARGTLKVSGDLKAGGSASVDGEVGLKPVAGRLKYEAHDVKLRVGARYIASVVDATLDGSSDVNGVLEFEAKESGFQAALRDVRIAGHDIKVRGPAASGATFDIARVDVESTDLDLTARTITFGKVTIDSPRATVRRLADGSINWTQLIKPKPAGAAAAPPTPDAAPWKILVKEAEIARGDVLFEDVSVDPAAKVRASAIAGTIHNIVGSGDEPADLELRTRFGSGGTLAVNGKAAWKPVDARLKLDARNLDVTALRPYVAARLNTILAKAEVSGRGAVLLAMPDSRPPQFRYTGSARIANLLALDPNGEAELLRWQAFDIDKVDVRTTDAAPVVDLGTMALRDFYARVIVSDQGRLNLVDLIKPAPAPASAPVPAREPAMAAAVGRAPAPTDSGAKPVIRIAKIEVERGNINFTDNFIKPNYTANMTGMSGSVTTLASDATEPATMTLAGKIDDDAPVEINGRLNPLAPKLFLDIKGSTKGVDLPRLTPYSVKYAGYPIVKGKLSMDVSYKIEDEKLNANNHLFLDQLTFGERVESPTATKLPVLLAVSLLTNTKGEIDLNLPITGSLNDPKFSIGGIIIQVIVNVLTKIVTAPFALLASAFGGGGEELGYVEFAAGSATLAPEQTKRIDTLAKALTDRPALKVDIIGRVDPAVDTEGARKSKLDAKLRAAKVRQVVRAGGESVDPSKVTITDQERPVLIAAVYDDEKIPDKPRNFIGIAKTIPAPEMEALIVANLAVTPEDLRALANQRATVVRNRLETEGKVPRERLFLVEPKLNSADIKDSGAKTRVDFSLK